MELCSITLNHDGASSSAPTYCMCKRFLKATLLRWSNMYGLHYSLSYHCLFLITSFFSTCRPSCFSCNLLWLKGYQKWKLGKWQSQRTAKGNPGKLKEDTRHFRCACMLHSASPATHLRVLISSSSPSEQPPQLIIAPPPTRSPRKLHRPRPRHR
jgi:hypothetical protein